MSDCPHFDRLSAYHDGELPPASRVLMAAHLAECPACSQALEELRQLSAQFSAATWPAMPRVALDRLALPLPWWADRRLNRTVRSLVGMAACLVVIAGGWFIITSSSVPEAAAAPAPWEGAAITLKTPAANPDRVTAEWIVADLSGPGLAGDRP